MKNFYTYIFMVCCIPCIKASERPTSPKPHTPQQWAQHYEARQPKPRIFPIYPWSKRDLAATAHAIKHTAPTMPRVEEETE